MQKEEKPQKAAPFTPESVQQLAECLAYLSLTPAELHEFIPQLNQILTHMEQLQEIQVDGIPPLMHPFDIPLELRPDQASPLMHETLNVPQQKLLLLPVQKTDDDFLITPHPF